MEIYLLALSDGPPIISFEKKMLEKTYPYPNLNQRGLLTACKFQWEIDMLLISAKRCVEVKKSLLLDRYLEMPLSCRSVEPNQIVINHVYSIL